MLNTLSRRFLFDLLISHSISMGITSKNVHASLWQPKKSPRGNTNSMKELSAYETNENIQTKAAHSLLMLRPKGLGALMGSV